MNCSCRRWVTCDSVEVVKASYGLRERGLVTVDDKDTIGARRKKLRWYRNKTVPTFYVGAGAGSP
jgi:hypothetical protein